MAFKTSEENRKSELTSIIDVVFLLLIFFLVTLSVAPKTEEEGENIRVIPRQITKPKPKKPEAGGGAKLKVNSIIQVLERKESSTIYVCINADNFRKARDIISRKKQSGLSDNNSTFIQQISGPPPFGANALHDISSLADIIKQGDKVSIRAPEMLPFSRLIEIYDLVKSKKANTFWGMGPVDGLHNLDYQKNENEWSQVF